jgi:hypothetical protein
VLRSPPHALKRLPGKPDRHGCHNGRTTRLQSALLRSNDLIAAHNGAAPDMRMFGDYAKFADLRIAIDPICPSNSRCLERTPQVLEILHEAQSSLEQRISIDWFLSDNSRSGGYFL